MVEFKVCFEEYEVSNDGQCRRRCKNGEYHEIKGSISNKGYRYFQVQRNGKRRNFHFHDVIAEQFIGRRPDGLVVDHINRNKLDNRVENLRYVTFVENLRNCDRYHDDINETDPIKRRNILAQRRYERKNGLKYRTRGSGQLTQRESGSWRAVITINKQRYDKTFKTREEAESYLSSFMQS